MLCFEMSILESNFKRATEVFHAEVSFGRQKKEPNTRLHSRLELSQRLSILGTHLMKTGPELVKFSVLTSKPGCCVFFLTKMRALP